MSRNVLRLLDLLRTSNGKAINALCIYMYFYNTYVLLVTIDQVFPGVPSKQEKKIKTNPNAIVYTTTDVVQWIHCACESASIKYEVYIAMIRREKDI